MLLVANARICLITPSIPLMSPAPSPPVCAWRPPVTNSLDLRISNSVYYAMEEFVAEEAHEQLELAEGMKDYVIVAAMSLLLITYLL